mgnify:CR=1 FL=1
MEQAAESMAISNNLEYQGFLKCGMCAILENNILLPVNHAAHILCMCRKGEEPYEEFRNRENGDKAAGAAPFCDRGCRRHVQKLGKRSSGHEVSLLGTSQGCGGGSGGGMES